MVLSRKLLIDSSSHIGSWAKEFVHETSPFRRSFRGGAAFGVFCASCPHWEELGRSTDRAHPAPLSLMRGVPVQIPRWELKVVTVVFLRFWTLTMQTRTCVFSSESAYWETPTWKQLACSVIWKLQPCKDSPRPNGWRWASIRNYFGKVCPHFWINATPLAFLLPTL